MAKNGFKIIDSDMHIMEPADLWDRYIDPKFRDRAPEKQPLPDGGVPLWHSDGKVFPAFSDHPERGTLNRARQQRGAQNFQRYAEARDRNYDAVSQLNGMDVEGIDVAVSFRTSASHLIAVDGMDPELSAAICRGFNRWFRDHCDEDPSRLKVSAIVPLQDMKLAAEEARHAVSELGAVATVLQSHPVDRRPFYDTYFDPLWSVAQELGVPVAFHGIHAAYQEHVGNRFLANLTLAHSAAHPIELMLSLGAMLCGGVFERFPGLTAAYLEGTCAWTPWWLWRLDEEWGKFGPGEKVQLQGLPSDYFKRQCYVSVDPSEKLVTQVVDVLGDEQIVISTDWPHDDSGYPEAINDFLAIEGLSAESKRKILWDNCARLYGIALP